MDNGHLKKKSDDESRVEMQHLLFCVHPNSWMSIIPKIRPTTAAYSFNFERLLIHLHFGHLQQMFEINPITSYYYSSFERTVVASLKQIFTVGTEKLDSFFTSLWLRIFETHLRRYLLAVHIYLVNVIYIFFVSI